MKQSGWEQPGFDDSAWTAPKVYGIPPAAPWKRVLPYVSIVPKQPLSVRKASVSGTAEAGSLLSLRLETDVRSGRFQGKAVLSSVHGKTITEQPVHGNFADGVLTVPVRLPQYFSTMPMVLHLSSDHFTLNGFSSGLTFQYRQKDLPGKQHAVTVEKNANGQPEFRIDGRPRFCIIANDLGNFIRSGVYDRIPADFRICSVLQNSLENEWQFPDGSYDFTAIDRCIENLLQHDRNALVIPAVGLEPPGWWGASHPGELARFNDGSPVALSTVSPSFASAAWKEHAMKALKKLVAHLEQAPYAPRLGGILLTNGRTYEWQYWGGHESGKFGRLIDYSEPMKKLFRSRHHAEIPDYAERMSVSDGLFFDPVRDRLKVAANRDLSKTLVGFMADAIRTVRSSQKVRFPVGVYYGYHFEYAGHLWTRELCGHNALGELLKTEKPDFIFSPPSYAVRQLGEPSADMKPFKSIENAGVLSILDDDTRTHMVPYSYFSQTMTPEQTRNLLRRNFGMALCRLQDISILPMRGPEFDSPETIADLKTIRGAGSRAVADSVKRSAEIAVVVDERAYDFLAFENTSYGNFPRREYRADGTVSSYNAGTLRLTGNLVSFQRARLGHIGAPVDYLLASDVEKNIGKYKFWIFLDVFTADDGFRNAVRKLRTSNNVLLWFYAPGVIADGSDSTENIARLTGIKVRKLANGGSPEILLNDGRIAGAPEELPVLYSPLPGDSAVFGKYLDSGEPAASVRMTGTARDVFWGGNVMEPEEFRHFAKLAGVHIYCDSDDVIFANERFLTFHASSAGKKTIFLPKKAAVTDLFSGAAVSDTAEQFSFDAKLHETRIFELNAGK